MNLEYSQEKLYEHLIAAGDFILAHNLGRLSKFRAWVKQLQETNAGIRRKNLGSDYDIEVFYNNQWRSINQMFEKVFQNK